MKHTFWLLCIVCVLQGCATVEPWERGTMAREEMAFVPDKLDQNFRDHIHYSKEGARMVGAGSGGGCGCN